MNVKIGDEVKIAEVSEVAKEFWNEIGIIKEIFIEDIKKRTSESHWDPVKVGEIQKARVYFYNHTLTMKSLALPVNYVIKL